MVPKGTEHKPSSPGGSILMFEPSGTLTTGDRHEGDIPAHVDSTTGRKSADNPASAQPPAIASAGLRTADDPMEARGWLCRVSACV